MALAPGTARWIQRTSGCSSDGLVSSKHSRSQFGFDDTAVTPERHAMMGLNMPAHPRLALARSDKDYCRGPYRFFGAIRQPATGGQNAEILPLPSSVDQ
jgi:hypothetical protein